MSDADLFKPDPQTSPFRERFDVDEFKRRLRESGEVTGEQAHHLALDLYEIDESSERMFFALRRGIIPKMEDGNASGALDAMVQYQIWLEHLTWHAETFLQAFEAWMSESDEAESDGAV